MSQVLSFSTNQQQFASLFGELQAELETDRQIDPIELNIANALWIEEDFPFIQTNGFQALELPYGSNQLSMVILGGLEGAGASIW